MPYALLALVKVGTTLGRRQCESHGPAITESPSMSSGLKKARPGSQEKNGLHSHYD